MRNTSIDSISADLAPRPFNNIGRAWVAVLLFFCLTGLVAYIGQLANGLAVTAMRDYSSWGIYISNFVFFVAISLVGSLMSAILKLSNVSWRTPLTRISEIIAVSAIFFAAIIIIVDMGRPDRVYHLFIYGRIQSPIIWDVIVITTYLVISILLLYMPLIPDLALLKRPESGLPAWHRKLYDRLSLGWTGSDEQKRLLEKSISILAVIIIPVAFSIHTVTSWLFATTLRPGWDSSDFGPYFVSGAFMVGAGAVICCMFVFRKFYGLGQYFTTKHFDYMGRLLVLLSLIYLYFNINEYFIPAYKMKGTESDHLNSLFTGEYAPMFWSVQIGGMIIPILVLLFKKGRRPLPIFVVSVLVIVGAWFKRFLIVVPTLSHPYIPIDRIPDSWKHYSPTLEEWSITIGSLAAALLLITMLVRLFPVIPVVETIEDMEAAAAPEKKTAPQPLNTTS